MDFPFFTEEIPKHWFAGLAGPTLVVNAVNLLFPAGERFFVRSVKHFEHLFEDEPEMLAQIRGFYGQEGRHAREHERFFELMESHGYEIRPFLDRYAKVAYGVIEKISGPELSLAATAAAEHFTAIMAHHAFTDDNLRHAHPVMRDLMLWHAAEEIEHKAVAFDVLQRVNPSYALRVAGLAQATVMLSGYWIAAFRMLMKQEGLTRADLRAEREQIGHELRRREDGKAGPDRGERSIVKDVFLAGIKDYLRPDFHPWDQEDGHMAADYLESIGRAEA